MATIFPKKRLRADETIDINDMNRNIIEPLREIESNMGEHNWAENAITDIATLESDSVLVTEHTKQTAQLIGSNRMNFDLTLEWQRVLEGDGLTELNITRVMGNSVIWVLFSCQANLLTFGVSGIGKYYAPGFEFAITVDGGIIPETITGSLDRSNDPEASGLSRVHCPVVLDCVLPVAPGSRTIGVVARALPNLTEAAFDLAAWISGTGTQKWLSISNRELILIEMK